VSKDRVSGDTPGVETASNAEAPRPASQGHARGPSKDELRAGFAKMWRLEWITLVYQIGAAALLGFLMGGSQVMKTEWMENALAIIPVAGVFLTCRTENIPPSQRHPFGHHRGGTIAFLAAAFVLAGIGTYLCYDSLMKLIHREYPAIGGYTAFGHTFWHGWLMIAAMFLTAIPPVLLAHAKIPVARLLHDKPLHADAEMNRANWMTNGTGIIGLGLVAWGFWWGDALAALLISLDIMRDGWTNVARSLSDVMDHHPVDLETDEEDSIIADVHRALRGLPFVADQRVLIREHGRYLFAEIFIEPNDPMLPATTATRQVREAVMPLDWRLQHLAVELTDDIGTADIVTREELEIESA
jgi:divalent metal cation (Fe/Co/Zn/Cd) transporter